MGEGYKPYRFPGGLIYLDVEEWPAMRRRAEGRYEPELVAGLQALLKPGMTFIDAGSNKGDFALIAAHVMHDEGRVLAFEPEPENCRWIRASVELNGYEAIEVFELALSDAEGRAPLYLGPQSGWHSLLPRRRPQESIEVETRTLDSLLSERSDPHADVLKIDVEGAELKLLHGAQRTLADPHLFAVFVEIHPRHVDPVQVCSVLSGHGFSLRDPKHIDVELRPEEVLKERRQLVAAMRPRREGA